MLASHLTNSSNRIHNRRSRRRRRTLIQTRHRRLRRRARVSRPVGWRPLPTGRAAPSRAARLAAPFHHPAQHADQLGRVLEALVVHPFLRVVDICDRLFCQPSAGVCVVQTVVQVCGELQLDGQTEWMRARKQSVCERGGVPETLRRRRRVVEGWEEEG